MLGRGGSESGKGALRGNFDSGKNEEERRQGEVNKKLLMTKLLMKNE